jgi:hypothetical protein
MACLQSTSLAVRHSSVILYCIIFLAEPSELPKAVLQARTSEPLQSAKSISIGPSITPTNKNPVTRLKAKVHIQIFFEVPKVIRDMECVIYRVIPKPHGSIPLTN